MWGEDKKVRQTAKKPTETQNNTAFYDKNGSHTM